MGSLFFLLGLLYNLTIPIWEADNEWSHFLYVQHLIAYQALPDPGVSVEPPPFTDQCRSGEAILVQESNHQFRQPPLYYLGGALATAWIDVHEGWAIAANPFRLEDPENLGRNFALHATAEDFPFTSATLAVHLLRLYSCLIGLTGLIAAYLLGLLLFSGRRELALAVMAANAFIPQYLFSASTVNNDILVGALGAWCVYFSIRAIHGHESLLTVVLSWVTAGLAVTAKYNGVILFPLVLTTTGVALFRLSRHRRQLRIMAILGAGLVMALLPVLLWFARNLGTYNELFVGYPSLMLQGDLFSHMVADVVNDVPREVYYTFVTFWGLMGWGTIPLPHWVISVLMVVTGICFLGVALFIMGRQDSRRLRWVVLLLGIFIAIGWLAGGIKRAEVVSPRGRYLLPAFSTVSALLVLGLKRLLPSRLEVAGRWILLASLLSLAIAVPSVLLRDVYAAPVIERNAGLMPEEHALNMIFGDFAELVGYRIEPERLPIGGTLEVTLVWQALQETSDNYVVSLALLDDNEFSHAEVSSHPGRGNYPTSRWRVGDLFRDTYVLRWTMTDWEWWPGLARIRIRVGCANPETTKSVALGVTDQFGTKLDTDLLFGQIKVLQNEDRVRQATPGEEVYFFGNDLVLEQFWLTQSLPGLGETMQLGLLWRALSEPPIDYRVQVHIVDEQDQQVGGVFGTDASSYYPMDLWDANEQVVQLHDLTVPLELPVGRYRILLSLYNPRTEERLPVHSAEAGTKQDKLLKLYDFEVSELDTPSVP